MFERLAYALWRRPESMMGFIGVLLRVAILMVLSLAADALSRLAVFVNADKLGGWTLGIIGLAVRVARGGAA